ncbi:MAG: bifunctional phosphoribosyl-AMP cyclohydrolase/phosphoribosyl-ATP diphosphatase HisIE [Xanthomonadales bacterium]|nr:Histidine biosynthesis bifunctional protein HisIE [Xanthomonadales bacterium]MCC6594610.1 bifunctional phosphoribosyl-AMP cyclohydrolase/phosphoribosyl-ATP diphosphatase HisIE [Xanthomonadales bacterium]MCE7932799.1 bifunctional phosphoribosyl-AMP cyclohydrolase/phosphoribosyl-ATP diphosphatase HisIE [Xanthomonadales bacterium PRO6]
MTPDWSKGLVPAIVQDADSGLVLMLGYMNEEALERTQRERRVTFYSRSKGRLWTKGESSGHVLELVSLALDCDADTLLVQARPRGPTCHTGTSTCFGDFPGPELVFLGELSKLVEQRQRDRPPGSYTTKLFESGTRRIAQKVGEEGVETALAAVAQDADALLGEAADLVYHLTVLLRDRGLGLADVARVLRGRHR